MLIDATLQYVRRDQRAYLFTRSGRQWWKNLRQPANVTLVLPEGSATGTAVVLSPEQAGEAARACSGTWLERAYRPGKDGVIVRVDLHPAQR